MVLIGGLDDVRFFSASCKLQSVASGLQKIINKQQIDENETRNLEWAGNLMGQLDFNSRHSKEHPELCVIATQLRPSFYKELLRLGIPFDTMFSEGLYETLKSYGKNVQLETEELEQTYQLFQLMARNILTEIECAQKMGYI